MSDTSTNEQVAGGETAATGASSSDTGQQQTTGTEASTETQAATQHAAATSTQAADSGKVEDLPDWAQRIIRDTRKEAGDARAAGKKAADEAQAALTKSIGKALGLIKDDEKPDPAKLTEQLTATQAEARTLKVERALDKAARKHGADEDLLVAVLAHNGELKKLDPTADDFTKTLDALVKTTVDANPKLKATQAAAASGVDGAGGSGEKPPADPKSVDEMRKLLKPSA